MRTSSRRNFIKGTALAGLGINSIPVSCIYDFDASKKKLPVFDEADICVIGGSCTGVFAAVRASRLGARVIIIEKQNGFGGVATNGLVNIWHSLYDTEVRQQIISGMTMEVIERLSKREAVISSRNDQKGYFTLNTQELKIELDELILEQKIVPWLHTLFSEPCMDRKNRITGVIVDGKSGRGIIRAKFFIDASGDGDLCVRMGLKSYFHKYLQPPTTCAYIQGFEEDKFNSLLQKYGKEFNIPEGYIWGSGIPSTNSYMLAGTRIYNTNCANADDLTKAEIEGRRQIRAMIDMIRKYGDGNEVGITNLPSYIGIRETYHINCLYQISDEDTLYGRHFDDAIANGSYVLDLHHQDKPGITFRYLNGTQRYSRPGFPDVKSRWREETSFNPTFYQVPLRALIPVKTENLIVAGRMLDAGEISFSGIRVMVNMNQVGEAAGVTAYLALDQNKNISDVSCVEVRNILSKGGSIII